MQVDYAEVLKRFHEKFDEHMDELIKDVRDMCDDVCNRLDDSVNKYQTKVWADSKIDCYERAKKWALMTETELLAYYLDKDMTEP